MFLPRRNGVPFERPERSFLDTSDTFGVSSIVSIRKSLYGAEFPAGVVTMAHKFGRRPKLSSSAYRTAHRERRIDYEYIRNESEVPPQTSMRKSIHPTVRLPCIAFELILIRQCLVLTAGRNKLPGSWLLFIPSRIQPLPVGATYGLECAAVKLPMKPPPLCKSKSRKFDLFISVN